MLDRFILLLFLLSLDLLFANYDKLVDFLLVLNKCSHIFLNEGHFKDLIDSYTLLFILCEQLHYYVIEFRGIFLWQWFDLLCEDFHSKAK